MSFCDLALQSSKFNNIQRYFINVELVELAGYPQIELSFLIVFITNNREAPTGPVFPVENDCLRILQLSGQFLPEHPTRYKIRCSKTSFWSLE